MQAQITVQNLYRFTCILLSLAFSWWAWASRCSVWRDEYLALSRAEVRVPAGTAATVRVAPASPSPRRHLAKPRYGSRVQSEGCKHCPAALPRATGRGTEEIYCVTEQARGSQALPIVKGSSNFCPSELGTRGNWDSDRCLSNTVCSRLGLWLPAALA